MNDRDAQLDMVTKLVPLAELEQEWRDGDVYNHNLAAITERLRDVADDYEDCGIWLAVVERHWREHPAYPRLRDALLARLGDLQAGEESRIAGQRDAIRQRFAADAWTARQLNSLLAHEV